MKDDLLNLKKKIDEAKETVSELKGSRTYLLKQLKEEFKCTTIEEAKEKKQALHTKNERLQTQMETETNALYEKYDID